MNETVSAIIFSLFIIGLLIFVGVRSYNFGTKHERDTWCRDKIKILTMYEQCMKEGLK